MTHKQRYITAMNFRQPDDMVAFHELEFQIYGEYVGEDPIMGYAYEKLSPAEKEKALGRNAEIFVKAADKAGHDVIKDVNAYWEFAPGVPALLWLPTMEDRLNQLKAIKKEAGDEFFLMCTAGGMIGTIPDGNHIVAFVDQIFEDPASVHATAESYLQYMIEAQKRFMEVGAEGSINATDIAFNTGTFLSPAQLDEFFFPYLERWAEACKKEGLFSVLHTDGDVSAVMDRIVKSGINALQCIDPLTPMEIIPLKEEVYGKLALVGNIDCSVLQNGTPEEVDTLCKEVILGCKMGGGFALGGCNAIFKGIPAENYQAMVDARKKYGRYQA